MTAPPGYSPPEGLALTPAMRAAFGALTQQQRTGRRGDQLLTGRWWREARERTFGPLDAWLTGRTT